MVRFLKTAGPAALAFIGGVLILGTVVFFFIFGKVMEMINAAKQAALDAQHKKELAAEAEATAAKFERDQIANGVDPVIARAEAERKRLDALPLQDQIERFNENVNLKDCTACQKNQPVWGQDIWQADSVWVAHSEKCLPIKQACNEAGRGFTTRPPGRISDRNDYTG